MVESAGDRVWTRDVGESAEVDWRLENDRERVVDPAAREVVAKLGAAAAARAGSNRAAGRQSRYVLIRSTIPSTPGEGW